jgi:O-antigen/teichoic acid export membrane protein
MGITNTLLRNIFWRGLYIASSLILNIAIARYFGASLSGWLFYTISIFALVIQVAGLSLESGIVYFAAGKKIPESRLAGISIFWALLVGLLILSAFSAFYPQTKAISGLDSYLMLYCLVYVCGNMLVTYFSNLFFARLSFSIPNAIGILMNILLVACIGYAAMENMSAINKETIIHIFFFSFLLQAMLLVSAWLIEFKQGINFRLPAKKDLAELFRYTLLACFSNIVFFLLYRVDYYFVNRFTSDYDLGNYIQVSKLAQLFFMLPGMVAGVIFPMTAGRVTEQIKETLVIFSRVVLLSFAILCLLLAAIGQWLFPFLFGEEFNNMYSPFLLLIPGILSLSTLYPFTAFFAGRNKMSVNITGSLIALFVIVILDLALIPSLGINGAAIASSCGYISYQLYVLSIFRREYKTRFIDFFIVRSSDIVRIKQYALSRLRNKS